MSKNTILIIVVLLTVAGIYFFYLSDERRQLFKAIPDSGIFALETTDARLLQSSLVENSSFTDWQHLAWADKSVNGFILLDSLFLNRNTQHLPSLLLSLHLTKADEYDFLFLTKREALKFPLPEIIDSLEKKGVPVVRRNFKRKIIYELSLKKEKQIFTIVQDGKIVLASMTPLLVDEALTQYHRLFTGNFLQFHQQLPSTDAGFMLHVFFENLPLLKTVFLKPDIQGTIFDWPAKLFSGASYEVSVHENRIALQGETLTQTNLLLNQITEQNCPDKITIANILPFNTAMLWYNRADNLQKIVRQQKKEFLANSRELDWAGQEWAMGFTEPASANLFEVVYAAVEVADSTEAVRSLKKHVLKGAKPFIYKGFTIGNANCSEMLSLIFGQDYAPAFSDSYYTRLGNFMLFTANKDHLQVIIENYLANQTLLKNENYAEFEKELDPKSNSFFYLQPERLTPLIKATSSDSFLKDFGKKSKYYNGFTPIAVQMDKMPDNGIKTTIHINYKKSEQKKDIHHSTTTLAWNVDLEDEPAAPPQIVQNHISGDKEIIVYDKSHNLYLISRNGKIIWKRSFDKPIMGKVQQLDLYNNGNLFFLFNTSNKVYLIDRNGKDVQDYPIKLSAEAVTGMTLADFDNNKNYSFFIPCGNNNIYGYHPNGRPLAGWSPRPYLALMAYELIYFRDDKHQLMVAANNNGNIYLLSPNGALKQKLVTGSPLISPPQIDIRSGEPKIVATAKNSHTYVFTLDGQKWSKKMVSISPTSGFLTENIQPDYSNEEYIFMSNNKVYAFNENKKLFTFEFKDKAKPGKIFPIRLKGEKNVRIGVYCPNTKQVFLLDENGENHPNFPIEAGTQFVCTDLLDNGGNVLIAGGSAKNLFAYTIQ